MQDKLRIIDDKMHERIADAEKDASKKIVNLFKAELTKVNLENHTVSITAGMGTAFLKIEHKKNSKYHHNVKGFGNKITEHTTKMWQDFPNASRETPAGKLLDEIDCWLCRNWDTACYMDGVELN